MDNKIGALIILYEPEQNTFTSAYNALASQVDGFCLVDNSSEDHDNWFIDAENIIYIHLKENKGIAFAQNVGVDALEKAGYDFVLFSDQDSVASSDLVKKLYTAYGLLESKGIETATLGCYAVDSSTGIQYSNKNIVRKERICINGHNYTVVDWLRSSMTLTNIKVFNEVGGMDEMLFIDGVDSEWCWRAYDKTKRKTILVEDAHIYHSLGHDSHKIINRVVTIPSSFRLFYQYRNYLWLIRRSYVPLRWKIRNGIKYVFKIPYYSFLCAPRLENFKQILRGIVSGI